MDADPMNPQRVAHRALQGAPERRDRHRRLRLVDQLVRPPREARQGQPGLALREPGDDGARHAVRHRGEARLSRASRDRLRRRRRLPDERHERVDHSQALHRRLARQAHDLVRLQQPRPEPGHVGAARPRRRPQVHGHAVAARLPVHALRRAARLHRHLLRRRRHHGAAPGGGPRSRPPRPARGKVDPEIPPLPPHITRRRPRRWRRRW